MFYPLGKNSEKPYGGASTHSPPPLYVHMGVPKVFLLETSHPSQVVGGNILRNSGDGEALNILSQYKTKRFEKLTSHRTVNFVFASLLNKIHVLHILFVAI